jgi:plastocyanin
MPLIARKMATTMARTAALLLALALVAALPARAEDAPAEAPVAATLGADGVQRATMTMGSYFYRPRHLVVTAGKPVELTLTAEEGFTPHDFVIDDPASGIEVKQDVGGGKTAVVRFTPANAGTFAIYCSKKAPFMASHRKKGMEGVLEVRAE